MAADEKWYFTKEQLANTPSRKCGYELDKELSYRQQAANFIQDMGQRLQVTQLCINTAIVYMHRFYVFHSFTQFHRNAMAAAALFLAAKVEEQPRKLEHVIRVAHMCLNRDQPPLDTKSEKYLEHAQDLVFNENVLLQTLGFDVAIDHPHTHVVRCCHLVRASKDLAQTSYFMASNSLHLTTMCLQYKPTVVACFCIHLACKWSNWEIPQSNEGKDWFWYVDKTVTLELLEQLTAEFLVIFDKCPTKLKRKIMSISAAPNPSLPPTISGSPFDMEPRKIRPPDGANSGQGPDGLFHSSVPPGSSRLPQHHSNHPGNEQMKPPDKGGNISQSSTNSQQPPQRVDYREYKEKKERERLAQQQQQSGSVRDGHHSVGHPGMHSNKSMPSSNNKHAAMMSASNSSMMGKAVPPLHHRDHKHPPPVGQSSVRPTNNAVSQSREALRREQAYARDASKREASLAQRGGEYIFAPPYRHPEAKEPALPTLGDIPSGQHHALSSESNHLSSSVNSGSRKDNQEWTGGETVNEVSEVTNKHDKTSVLVNRASDMKEKAENRHTVNLHHDPNLKRAQQPIYEHSNKHSNRIPSEHRASSGMTAVDGRSSKEANLPQQKPSSDVSERQTYNHSSKHSGASGSVGNERMDHSRHRRTGTSEPYHSRPPSHSVADIPVEHKANLPEFERKSNVMDLADRKPNVEAIDRKPAIADLPERKPDYQYLGVSDAKHEGSSRRPGNSVLSYHQATVKREPKVENSSVVKKEESLDGRGVSSNLRPPQQQIANVAAPSHRSRTRSPSQQPGHDRSPSLPRSRSPAVPTQPKSPQLRSKSPNIVSVSNSSSVKRSESRSESPHHTRTKSHSNRNDSTTTQTNEEQVVEVKSKRSETASAKMDTAAMTIKTEIDPSAQVPQVTKSSSSSSQRASLSATPDKSTSSSSRESPYSRSSKCTRQRTPPSSGSKKQSTPAPTPESALSPLSPFGSPPPPTSVTPGKTNLRATSRHRTSSSSSEPELVPVVKKLDEIAGYENIIRDSKMGIKLPGRVPDIIPPIRDRSKKDEAGMLLDGNERNNATNQSSVAKELKPPDLIQPFSAHLVDQVPESSKPLSLEGEFDSDPTEIAFPSATVLQPTLEPDIQNSGIIDVAVVDEPVQNALPVVTIEGIKAPTSPEGKRPTEHHHKSEKKKKKKEHKEHKHKDKDKNREEKKHRHKHKDKDKDRHKEKTEPASAPIKITIPKDKINLSSTLEPASGSGLKLKIQKDRLKGTDSTGSSPQSTPIKIKISKEMINFNNSSTGSSNQVATVSETTLTASSRKRDRSSPRSSELVSPPGPPAKSARLTANEQRSRSSYGKQNGVEHHHRSSRGSSAHYTGPAGASGNKVRGRGRGNRGGRYSTPPPNHPMAHVPHEAYQAYPMPAYYAQPYGHPASMVPPQHYMYDQMYGYYAAPQPPFAIYQHPPPMPPGPPPGENAAPPLPEGAPPLPEGPPPEDIPPPPPPPE